MAMELKTRCMQDSDGTCWIGAGTDLPGVPGTLLR